jgi:hypothetical protein
MLALTSIYAALAATADVLLWQSPASFNTVDYDTGVLVATLQGLVNRNASFGDDGHTDSTKKEAKKPLFIDSFELFNTYVGADRFWIEHLQQKKAVRFTNVTGGVDGLLAVLGGAAKGVVMYGTPTDGSGDPDGSRYVALTLCGLEGLLPVTSALRAKHPALAALPVTHDLRGKFNSSFSAYSWSLQQLMPRVNQSAGWSGGRSHTGDDGTFIWQGGPPELGLLGLDLAVARRAFMFNLSPNATLAPSEARQFDVVMAGLNGSAAAAAAAAPPLDPTRPLPAIYGWTEPESEYTVRVSRGGGYVVCSEAPNLSFWAYLQSSASLTGRFGEAARAAAPAPPPPLQPGKVYVTFQTNEGDTPKIVAGLFGGSWLNPRRGSVPIAWGVNLLLAREFPALMEFYLDTATANDTFFGGTSGAGYVFPSEMPAGAFRRYTALAQELARDFVAPPPPPPPPPPSSSSIAGGEGDGAGGVSTVSAATTAAATTAATASAPAAAAARAAAATPPDWTVDIWNWGASEGQPGRWSAMVDAYANAAPAIGAFTQQALSANATTVCLGSPGAEAAVNFAPKSLWYPGSGGALARWSGGRPTRASALDDLEARIRATRAGARGGGGGGGGGAVRRRGGAAGGGGPGLTPVAVFTLVYGLIDGASGPEGLDAVDAAVEMVRRLPGAQYEVVGAQEMARLSRLHCSRSHGTHGQLLLRAGGE